MISTHAPAGGATGYAVGQLNVIVISTHAPAGGATSVVSPSHILASVFLLTPLREGRPFDIQLLASLGVISTHAPAGGATSAHRHSARRSSHFYSRPCGRGDETMISSYSKRISISTHAPAGGATSRAYEAPSTFSFISTHAPAGGATHTACRGICSLRYFYSRPCGRGDSNFPQVRHEVLRQIAER